MKYTSMKGTYRHSLSGELTRIGLSDSVAIESDTHIGEPMAMMIKELSEITHMLLGKEYY